VPAQSTSLVDSYSEATTTSSIINSNKCSYDDSACDADSGNEYPQGCGGSVSASHALSSEEHLFELIIDDVVVASEYESTSDVDCAGTCGDDCEEGTYFDGFSCYACSYCLNKYPLHSHHHKCLHNLHHL
jgi:hypothetical protein